MHTVSETEHIRTVRKVEAECARLACTTKARNSVASGKFLTAVFGRGNYCHISKAKRFLVAVANNFFLFIYRWIKKYEVARKRNKQKQS